jgi:O-antigen/teichoic acid export membrane protein
VPLLLLLLLPNVLSLAAVRPLYSFFQVQMGKPASMFRVVAAALIANTALNLALVPPWGARGAAVAATVAGIVAFLVAFRAFAAESHARIGDLRPRWDDLMAYVELAASVVRRARRGR